MRIRRRHITLNEAKAGLVLCAPISIVNHGVLRCFFPAGHTLTADNLHQLATHHAEFMFISEADTRTDEQITTDNAQTVQRVMEIFSAADWDNPITAALYDQVLAYRSTL